jgi:ubiquinone/menaquinone biosynthesis C-methylase UbiE
MTQDRDEHPLVFFDEFHTLADFGIFLMHKRDYEEAARLVRDRSVLDLGCNNGYGSRILAGACRRVTAVDISEAAIADAIRRFGDLGINFQWVDGITLPFQDGTFDAVVSFQVIEHVDEPDGYLSEIVRVLGPEGQAIFTTPNKAIRLDPGMAPWNKHHIQEFTHQELRDLLASYFTRVRIRGQFASGDLHRIERARCARSRALARSGVAAKVQRWLRANAPVPIRSQLRALRDFGRVRRSGSRTYTHLDNKEYSTAQYSYRDTDLDEALSLFAIGWKAAS